VDEVFHQAVLFNCDASLYVEMKTAGKVSDWGRIEDILPLLICCFRGGSSKNYAGDLLHLLQNLRHSWPEAF
ncbi:hypothetical protein BS47DRAFT_1271950, partial [Hydnum rufescens UP504]